jgi:subtilisin family serine protease
MKRTLSAALLSLAPFAPLPAYAGDAGVPGVDPRIDDRMIVRVTEGADIGSFLATFAQRHPEAVPSVADQVPGRPIYLVAIEFTVVPTDALLDLLAADLDVGYAGVLDYGDFLYENQAPEGKSGSTYVDGIAEVAFLDQYARTRIRADVAQASSRGQGTVVAVVDTGVDATHPRLAGRVLASIGYDFIDRDASATDAPNGVDDDGDGAIDEMSGHGTYVAGLVSLIAPDAKILPVRVLNSDGVGDEWALTRGIYHAIDRGVEVVNLSLGSTYDTVSVVNAVADAARVGIVVVASAGNLDRSDPREFPAMDDIDPDDPIFPPLQIRGAFGVAATDPGDVKADFSSFNRRLVISAPGDSSGVDPATSIVGLVPGDGYAVWEGTSFATALVSATAALVRAQHPEWPATLSTYSLVELVLTSTAADIYAQNPEFAGDRELGAGRLDAGAAVALGPPAPERLGDLDNDGDVDFADLLNLLEDWGLVHTSADLDGNGSVAFGDLLIQLANWG